MFGLSENSLPGLGNDSKLNCTFNLHLNQNLDLLIGMNAGVLQATSVCNPSAQCCVYRQSVIFSSFSVSAGRPLRL